MSNPLAQADRPKFEEAGDPIRIVDLFSGCGGISLGIAQAALAHERSTHVALAVDFEPLAIEVYKANFPEASDVRSADIMELLELDVDADPSDREKELARGVGHVDLLAGGPPCQGHSSLNNHTRGNDPKNALYKYMARAARILEPRSVLIENVPSVTRDRYNGANVVDRTVKDLLSLGYSVDTAVIQAQDHGVAQTRKRHVLVAVRGEQVEAATVLRLLDAATTAPLTVRQALAGIEPLDAGIYDKTPAASKENLSRMQFLEDQGELNLPNRLRPRCQQGVHSYKSMYGRLSWDLPAQTITSGFGSIGQGRFMHPGEVRALTPHEAARLQGFPDYFDFSSVAKRGALARMIGNAVPPPVAKAVATALLDAGALGPKPGSDTAPRKPAA